MRSISPKNKSEIRACTETIGSSVELERGGWSRPGRGATMMQGDVRRLDAWGALSCIGRN